MKNNMKTAICALLTLAIGLSHAACTKTEPETPAVTGESETTDDLYLRSEGETGKIYENDGFRLLVPLEYDELLLTETPENNPDGILFDVSEKASVEAAEAMGSEDYGPGWLFSIGRADDARQKMMRCFDMSGAEIFAADNEGNFFVFYHPTDVRYMREDDEALQRDQGQWSALTAWTWDSVRSTFLRENGGLSEKRFTNTLADMYLARLAYLPGVEYTLSTAERDTLSANAESFDTSPWLDTLVESATFAWVDESETPDGEYVVLAFPDDDVRFDFFRMEGKENYVRAVWFDGEYSELYLASFADGATKASDVMQAWYDALAAQNGVEDSA